MFKSITARLNFVALLYWLLMLLPLSQLFLLPLSGHSHVLPHNSKSAGNVVQVWMTTLDRRNRLTQQKDMQFGSDSGTSHTTIDVDEQRQFQQIEGFGAAMTDTSAWLIGTKLQTTQRDALMRALFDHTSGIGLSFVRIPMGSSDYTVTGTYSYDDLPNGQQDAPLAHFSIRHDDAYSISVLRQALQINPDLKFMANPWSPPAWMKTNHAMLGTAQQQGGYLLPSAYAPLARYFVAFIQAYEQRGIPIYAITPQNEPLHAPLTFPGMYFPASDEARFIKNNLGPALAAAHLSTKIFAFDHPWVAPRYSETLLNDPAVNRYVAAIAWHCYSGDPSIMTTMHTLYPTKDMYETECSTGVAGSRNQAIDLAIRSTQNWARAAVLWNLVLDTHGGPKMGHGCDTCIGMVTIDQATGNYTFTDNYYQLGQVSKFVLPGAYHIASTATNAPSLQQVAFKNPDGSKALVVHNTSLSSTQFKVRWHGKLSFLYTLPAGGIATFTWR
jgi:glucosylceramidase